MFRYLIKGPAKKQMAGDYTVTTEYKP
jgi:hypothetical protein